VKGRLLLDVVAGDGAAVPTEVLTLKNQAILIRGDSHLVLDFGHDHFDGVFGLDLKGDGLARQCLDEDLHLACKHIQQRR